jgi:hypothetical protein
MPCTRAAWWRGGQQAPHEVCCSNRQQQLHTLLLHQSVVLPCTTTPCRTALPASYCD